MSRFEQDFQTAWRETMEYEREVTITYESQSVSALVKPVRDEQTGKVIAGELIIKIHPDHVAAPLAGHTGTVTAPGSISQTFRVREVKAGDGGIWELTVDV